LYFVGFCPGRILFWEDFVLYLCTSMVNLMIYVILEYFFPGRILSQRRILSSAFSLRYYLNSVVAMIEFWRILSWEDFVLYLCTFMVSLMICGILVTCLVFFVPRRILSSAYALDLGPCLSYYSNWKILSSGGFYPREDFIQKYSIPFHISSREDF
jgi:hypothetical protein